MRQLLGALAVGLLGLGCNNVESRPCLSWVHPGDAYDVKLGTPDPVPIDPRVLPVHTCGRLDLSEGFTVKVQTQTTDAAWPTCTPTSATTSNISGIMLRDPGDAGVTAIDPDVEAEYPHAIVATTCNGVYRLGLSDDGDGVLRGYRFFSTKMPDECAAVGLNVDKDQPYCWDSWRVVVKDSQGNIVATSVD